MTISAAFVLFSVLWFLILFIALPLKLKTQSELGTVIDGTPPSAPENPQLKRKMIWVSIVTLIIWIPLCLVIISGVFSISDLDFYGKLRS